ncbi:hypothetical protein EMIHUDRAFT_435601 [Emiliania huxleyi CCMP1516]|uniref:Lipocalin-like domain-containing protein n=2 Tax=Emiliania huxleyi TaxID=2903 RepID=A0A0D3JFC1_EMIH1|nr:hypothetical protein EMIHUDRAFT_435601 [Emiliania huxleyi CCMP1516]EOD22206.1 hypothetical protein EMIHUDRAFT_435601 [Emiliania huxleyi CCMP1516]|mmetsp:Transcript_13711/g.39349  ORF Transcript_13711/g.39349 Transcript_13711/m.39349 type:complete len:369 (+) Transcript_13711:63-1169(+)|eukprot:XP_005774635.1 hypothetical protein EMIHUDRAFT_435601 [Emiliania huxleyi CCMP1516]
MGAEVSRLGADRYSPGAILRFIAHIGKMSVGNISDGFRSALDTELERGKALAASAYQMHIGWRETSPEWTDFPWARAPAEGGSAEQVVCDWLEAVGLEPLPHGVAWNLLRIDSALLACWEEEEEEKASPAPLDNFPSYAEASDAVTPPSRPLHHPAWLPLALLMATTGEDANAWSIFPLNMLIAPPSVAAHFRLSKLMTPDQSKSRRPSEVSKRMFGMWELTSLTNSGRPLPGGAKGRIFYSGSFFCAQVTGLKGLLHFNYSGTWHAEGSKVYHVCLCNSPQACYEKLAPRPELEAAAEPRLGYGAVRVRSYRFCDDGTLDLMIMDGEQVMQVLKWKRVDAYSEASGGRWDMSMTSRPAAPEEVGKED